ncbi:hypothetical protein [Nocardia nova]|uniref:hypothetical protein n=1 Tax=Nocardia nova TaxID=37330 RepID=UPI0033CAD6FB
MSMVFMSRFFLSREQVARVNGLSAESLKSYTKKGLMLAPDIVIGGDGLVGQVPRLDPELEAKIQTRPGWLPVSALSWERVGRGGVPEKRDDRTPHTREIRSHRGEAGGYSSEQLQAAAKCVEAASWVVVHLRREPTPGSDVWPRWNELYQQAVLERLNARAEFDALFRTKPPTPEQVLGMR